MFEFLNFQNAYWIGIILSACEQVNHLYVNQTSICRGRFCTSGRKSKIWETEGHVGKSANLGSTCCCQGPLVICETASSGLQLRKELRFFCWTLSLLPQRNNSKRFDNQNGAADHHFEGRRLPARIFQQGLRFAMCCLFQRFTSDDYYEPTMGRGGGRPRRYDGSDEERRKHDGRYEIFPQVKGYGSDGVVRRFRFEAKDSFVSRNTHNNYNDSDNNGVAARRPRNVYLSELVKRKAN